MFRFLEKLRSRPQHQKQLIAYGLAGGITLVIFVFWLVTFMANIETNQDSTTKDIPSIAEVLEEGIGTIKRDFSAAKRDIQQIRETENTPTTTPDGSPSDGEETAQPQAESTGEEGQNVLE